MFALRERGGAMKPRLVVIGNGMAAIRTLEELLSAAPDKYQISVFGSEPYGNYNRILLSAVLAGDKTVEQIITHPRSWYVNNGICLHTGFAKTVQMIQRHKREVITQDGTTAPYDRLLIATGSTAFVPPIAGSHLEGVMRFRDIADVEKMLAYSQSQRHAIVLGGGLLGLEAANGLALRGMQVTVIHNNAVLLNRQLDAHAGQLLQRQLEQRGLHFKMNCATAALIGNAQGHICRADFTDGTQLPCDLFVMAVGVRPNIALAQRARLYCERGIVVNDTLQTYDPRIYAVGECVQHRGETFGLIAPLYAQAKVCANHLSQHGVGRYMTLPTATQLKVTGIALFSVGDYEGDALCETLLFTDKELGIYKKLVLKAGRLIGAVLYGDTSDGAWYSQLIAKQSDITPLRETLLFGQNETE